MLASRRWRKPRHRKTPRSCKVEAVALAAKVVEKASAAPREKSVEAEMEPGAARSKRAVRVA